MQPSDIDIRSVQWSFRHYLELLAEGRLVFGMAFDFHDPSRVAMSSFVESLLVRIPPATIWLHFDRQSKYTAIFGRKQLLALQLFTQEKYALCNLTYFPEHEGAKWSTLPRYLQRRIEDMAPNAYCIEAGVPDDVVADILYRIKGLS